MNENVLSGLVGQLPTPAYVFDLDEFRQRALAVKDVFGPETNLCFSIKANPFLLTRLPEYFDKIEVCSPGELTICEKTGMDMGKVIFSGVNKTYEDVERALDDAVGVFTAESLLHLKLIHDGAKKRGITVPVLLRLTSGSQFGMDETAIRQIVADRDSYPAIRIVGIHFFSGTQKFKAAQIEKELTLIEGFIQAIRQDYDFVLERVEYGTGLGVDYFCEDAEEKEMARLQAVAPAIRALAEKTDLTVEMGRFFAAPCGYYLTKVMDAKCNCGIHYAIVDGGMNQLKYAGQLYGMQIPRIRHFRNRAQDSSVTENWTLCGSLCTTADVLAKNVPLQGLEIGDTLVFERTGAYSAMEGIAIFLSREMPVISTYSRESGLKIHRQRILTDIFNTP